MKKENIYNQIKTDEFVKGAIYSIYNAYELFGDAMIMYSFDRLPRVYSLIKLSLEEASKSLILFEIHLLKNTENESFLSRVNELIYSIQDHNLKTEFAVKFLISKQKEFINNHPNTNLNEEDSGLFRELEEYENLLKAKKTLDFKKNTNLYTSLIGREFKPPFLSVEESDVDLIKNITFRLLGYAKRIILKVDDKFYENIEIKKNDIKSLDALLELRNVNKIKTAYHNQIEKLRIEYPNLKLETL